MKKKFIIDQKINIFIYNSLQYPEFLIEELMEKIKKS